jgi:hypothetical protein
MKTQTANRVKNPAPQQNSSIVTDKAVKLFADSIFRQLRLDGCAPRDIISVSTQLLDLVTSEIQVDSVPKQ